MVFQDVTGDYCPSHESNFKGNQFYPVLHDSTVQKVAFIFTATCGILTLIISSVLIMKHALRYSKPKEQKHIIRIISMLIFFAILSWITSFLDNYTAQYVIIVMDLYESFVFGSFFLLVCSWISQAYKREAAYLDKSVSQESYANPDGSNRLRYGVPKIYSALIFQFPLVTIFLTIATEITNYFGVFCVTSHSIKFAHVWVSIFLAISTAIAFISLVNLCRRYKEKIAEFKPMGKFIAFKSIIALRFLQSLIFSFLASSNFAKSSNSLTRTDISASIPAMILSLEMVLYSMLFHYVFRTRPYTLTDLKLAPSSIEDFDQKSTNNVEEQFKYRGGFLGIRALWQAFNILDLICGTLAAPWRFIQVCIGD